MMGMEMWKMCTDGRENVAVAGRQWGLFSIIIRGMIDCKSKVFFIIENFRSGGCGQNFPAAVLFHHRLIIIHFEWLNDDFFRLIVKIYKKPLLTALAECFLKKNW